MDSQENINGTIETDAKTCTCWRKLFVKKEIQPSPLPKERNYHVNSQMLMLKNLKSNASTNIYKCHHEWSTNAFKLLGSIRMYIGSLTMP
jgi:hypothetical protein